MAQMGCIPSDFRIQMGRIPFEPNQNWFWFCRFRAWFHGSDGMHPIWIQNSDGMHPIGTEPELILVLQISNLITWLRWNASHLKSEFRWDAFSCEASHLNFEFRWDASHLNRARTDSVFADAGLCYMTQMWCIPSEFRIQMGCISFEPNHNWFWFCRFRTLLHGSDGMHPTRIHNSDGMHPIWTEPELILVLQMSNLITWLRWDASHLNQNSDGMHLIWTEP